MKMLNRIFNSLGYQSKKDIAREIKKANDRGWLAAQYSRYQQGWSTSRTEINREINSDLPALRARARDLRLNNPIVAGTAFDNRVNVIGPNGFELQPMTKYADNSDDEFANSILKNKFDEWCNRKYCTITQRYSFVMLQYIIADHLLIDGSVILRKHYAGKIIKDNPFGLSFEIIDVNDIDHTYTMQLSNGNAVINGIEVDEYRRIVGIWVREKSIINETIGGYNSGFTRVFIDAKDLIIAFDPMHYKQVHGITALASVMLTLKDVDMWETYSLQNAKHGAAKMGFIQKTDASAKQYVGSVDENGNEISSDSSFGKYMDMEGGSIEELDFGQTFAPFDPKFPHEQHNPFVRAMGRKIAAGLGRDYTSMYGDRENESYSSARTGELKMRGAYEYMQTIIREQVLIPIYEEWVKYALLNNALAPLSSGLINKYIKHWWQGYIRGWVDPYKEFQANQLAEEQGYKSKTQIVAGMGNRYEDVLADKKREKELEQKYGITYAAKEKQSVSPEPTDSTTDVTARNYQLVQMRM